MAARNLLKKADGSIIILERYELIERINKLNNIRDQALVAFLYLTACRISEVVPYIVEKKKGIQDTRQLKGEPIKKKQIEFFNDVLIIRQVRTLKRKKYIPKSIPIVIAKEIKFVEYIKEYTKSLSDEDFLFNMTRQRALQIMNSIGLYNHYLRHLRLTHLATDYGFSGQELKHFVNWSSSNTADNYVHLNVDNLINKMMEIRK